MTDITTIMARALALGATSVNRISLPKEIYGRPIEQICGDICQALTDAGYAIVPVDPTDAMLEAGCEAGPVGCCNPAPGNVYDIWKTTITAALEGPQ